MEGPIGSELFKFAKSDCLCDTISRLIQSSDGSAIPVIHIAEGKGDIDMGNIGATVNDDELDDLVEEQLVLNKIKEMQSTRRNLDINRLQPNKSGLKNSLSIQDKNNDDSDSVLSFRVSSIDNDDDRYKEDLDRLSKALTLNVVMQSELNKLEIFLVEKLKQNQMKQVEAKKEISQMKQISDKVSSECTSKSWYFRFGIPYFKDEKRFPCDNNLDVMTMKYHNQILSINFKLCKMWKLKEKTLLEEGVRACLVEENIAELVVLEKQMQEELQDVSSNSKKKEIEQELARIKGKIETVKRKSLTNLFVMCPVEREFDWIRVSINHVRTRSDLECQRMWHLYVKPSVNKAKWTPKEDNRLLALVEKFQKEDWDTIAEELRTSRTGYQCFVNYQTRLNKEMRKLGKWTAEEDKMLASLVARCRVGYYIPWPKIAYYFQSRSLSQIYCRWNSSLNPDLKKGRFTRREDKKIVSFVRKFGEDFSKIAKMMGDRTSVQIRERYLRAIPAKYQNSGRWSLDEDKLLMSLVKKHGVSNWRAISNQFVTRTRTQVRQRYAIIKRILERNPNIELEDFHRGPSAQLRSLLPPVCSAVKPDQTKTTLLADLIERSQIEETLLKQQNNSLMSRIKAGRKRIFKRSEVDTKLITYFREAYANENLKLKTYYLKPDTDSALNALAVFCQFFQTHITLPQKEAFVYKQLPLTLRRIVQKMQERFTNWGCDCLRSAFSKQSYFCFCQDQNPIDYLPVDLKATLVDDSCYMLSSLINYQKPVEVKKKCKCSDNRANHFIPHYLPPNIITSIAFRSILLIKDKIAISLVYDKIRSGFFTTDDADYQYNGMKKFTGCFSDDSSEEEGVYTSTNTMETSAFSESTSTSISEPSTSSGSMTSSRNLCDTFQSHKENISSDGIEPVKRLTPQEAINLWKERLMAILGWPIVLSNQPSDFSCNTDSGRKDEPLNLHETLSDHNLLLDADLRQRHAVHRNENTGMENGSKRRKLVEVDPLECVPGEIISNGLPWDNCNQQVGSKYPNQENCDTELSSTNEVKSKVKETIKLVQRSCDESNTRLNQIEVSGSVVGTASPNHSAIKKVYKCYSRKRPCQSSENNN